MTDDSTGSIESNAAERIDQDARLFRGLENPERVAIFHLLTQTPEMSAQEIQKALANPAAHGLPKAHFFTLHAVSHHLRIMQESGLVDHYVGDRQEHCYSIIPDGREALQNAVLSLVDAGLFDRGREEFVAQVEKELSARAGRVNASASAAETRDVSQDAAPHL